ncbi:MAG: DUF6702 family protein [Bacteroidota bacterium]|nr:DUF6702 family protein [Bacteroidota bacterium]
MKWAIIIAFLVSSLHPVYVSFNTLELDEDEDKLVLMSRIFYDDLTKAAENAYDMEIDTIGTNADITESDLTPLLRYYKDKVQISVNNKGIPPENITLDRFEIRNYAKEDMTIRLFFSIPLETDTITSVQISNPILTELHHGQSNLLITNIYNKQESFRLTNDNYEVTLKINE